MEILRRSPMLAILISLVSALALYDKFQIYSFIFGMPLIFTGITFCSYEQNFPQQWKIFFSALIFSILCSARIYYGISRPDIKNFDFKNENGLVTSVRQWGRMYALIIETENYGKFVARLNFEELLEGTRINFNGSTKSFKPKSKNSDFDEDRYWKARDAQAWLNVKNIKELPQKFSLSLMRQKISRTLTIYFPTLTSQYLKAAWLGEHTQELDNKHRKWGTSHLLAVSGFHVGIVILCSVFLFGGKNIALLSLILWSYIILTGASSSAMRAGLMLQIGLFSRFIGRRINGLNSVSIAAVILLFYRPFLYWDIGFRLSVLAALTLCSMPPKDFRWIFVSSIIFLVTFPQISYSFKGVPLVGIILNIFAPLYFSFAFIIASVVVVLTLINFPFAEILLMPVEGIFLLWEKFADFFANIITFVIKWNYFTAWIGTGLLIFMVCKRLNFSLIKSIFITTALNFTAFIIFL